MLLVLFRRADPLGSEQHHPGLGTKAHTLGPGTASSLSQPGTCYECQGTHCPIAFVLHQESTSFENSSSKDILYHGHSQVTWTCFPVNTWPLKYRTSISSRSSACELGPAHIRLTPPLHPLLVKSAFTHVLRQRCMRKWGWTPAGLFPCSVFWCYYHWCLVMPNSWDLPLSHDGRWLQLALVASGWDYLFGQRGLLQRKSCRERLRGARLATGADVVSSSIKPSFWGGWDFLLMLWCSEHDSTCSHHTALGGQPHGKPFICSISARPFCHRLFLSPCVSVQVIS